MSSLSIPPGFSSIQVKIEADLINPDETIEEKVELVVRQGTPRQVIAEQVIGMYANTGGIMRPKLKGRDDEFIFIPFARIKGNLRISFPMITLAHTPAPLSLQ